MNAPAAGAPAPPATAADGPTSRRHRGRLWTLPGLTAPWKTLRVSHSDHSPDDGGQTGGGHRDQDRREGCTSLIVAAAQK